MFSLKREREIKEERERGGLSAVYAQNSTDCGKVAYRESKEIPTWALSLLLRIVHVEAEKMDTWFRERYSQRKKIYFEKVSKKKQILIYVFIRHES